MKRTRIINKPLLWAIIVFATAGQAFAEHSVGHDSIARDQTNSLRRRVDALKADEDQLQAKVATNTTDIAANQGNISTNSGNISTNATDIAANQGNISTNSGNISTNATDIAANQGNISTNSGNISTNATDISDLSAVAWNEGNMLGDIVYTTGDVGIGTRNPGALLTVLDEAGGLNQSGVATIGIAGPTKGPCCLPNAAFQVHNPAVTDFKSVEVARFTVPPGMDAFITLGDTTHTNTGTQAFISYDTFNKQLLFGSHFDPFVAMSIRGAAFGGEVGIGTTDPKFTLDVIGNIGINGVFHVSDVRWKRNIETIPNALDSVLKLRGVSYEWRTDEFKEMKFAPGKHIGLIAQEVEKAIPEVVATAKDGYKSVEYANLTALLIEAVKELKAEKDELQVRIEALERTASDGSLAQR